MDEATSALDTKTEKNIQDALSKVCAGKTTLIGKILFSTILSFKYKFYLSSMVQLFCLKDNLTRRVDISF